MLIWILLCHVSQGHDECIHMCKYGNRFIQLAIQPSSLSASGIACGWPKLPICVFAYQGFCTRYIAIWELYELCTHPSLVRKQSNICYIWHSILDEIHKDEVHIMTCFDGLSLLIHIMVLFSAFLLCNQRACRFGSKNQMSKLHITVTNVTKG